MFSIFNFKPKLKSQSSPFTPQRGWVIVRKLHDRMCGEHFLVQNTRTGQFVMKKTVFRDDEDKARALKQNLDAKLKDQNPHALKLHAFELRVQREFCSQSFFFSLYYDYPDDDLGAALVRQIDAGASSSGEQLLKIAYNTLAGLAHLQGLSRNRDAGLLQLDRIYYDRASNDYRVVENIAGRDIFDFYFDLLVAQSSLSVFSPETVAKRPLINKQFDLSKIDCFNLGLILLCFGLNLRPRVFYKKRAVDLPLLAAKQGAFTEKYRGFELLCDLVWDLLTVDIRARPGVQEVLRKYPGDTDLAEYRGSSVGFGSQVSMGPRHVQSELVRVQGKKRPDFRRRPGGPKGVRRSNQGGSIVQSDIFLNQQQPNHSNYFSNRPQQRNSIGQMQYQPSSERHTKFH